MIFVVVGQQGPFDRLVKKVDAWAAFRNRDDVFAQIGPTKWHPRHIAWANFISYPEFCRKLSIANAVVAHAGTGVIIEALRLYKPILVMPRQEHLKETRGRHQYVTACKFFELGYIEVAFDENELFEKLDKIDSMKPKYKLGPRSSSRLIDVLRAFVNKN